MLIMQKSNHLFICIVLFSTFIYTQAYAESKLVQAEDYFNQAQIIHNSETDTPDYAAAAALLKKAADLHYAPALYMLGMYALNGLGCEADPQAAFSFFNEAANYGYTEGLFIVGCCFEYGYGVEKNEALAADY